MSSATHPLWSARNGISRARDYAELIKLRVTTLIVLTAWTGFYLGALKSGVPSFTWALFHALLGIGLVSGGTAAFNEVLEREADALMRRTATRPLPARRMSLAHATVAASTMILGGTVYLALTTNNLTALLTLGTAVFYLTVYTPLKRRSPICTFVGAFSGAMPPLLGWTANRGRVEWEGIVLFAIVFLWQFPHFFSIAWLYREDYANASIRMLPVVESDGRSTAREIIVYSLLLIPMSVAPSLLGMTGRLYLSGALLLSAALFWFGYRLAAAKLPPTSPHSKAHARFLLQATVIYLPLLFGLMMINAVAS
ncbi:MAG TPA: heme o synthase [Terriglobales bacterium]|nr:heme o synthase [Terriglobales bacterium]